MITPKLLPITTFLFLFSALIRAENPTNSRKLDEYPSDMGNKCGDCPCDNPCNPQMSPPPPSPPPPSPPPAPQNPTTPTNYCPPPPAVQKPPKGTKPPYISINGPPGNVYPVYQILSGVSRCVLIGKFPYFLSFVSYVLAF